ncbi:DUF4232 domain-containing protein [Plantibacter sp. YIM 135347]|uniref:DUF4232 domain-containing protein n=1 Tax=Plantibacter sp. YIM 135347 TaxID=3423919 RepID=UPI003D3589DA
MGKTRTISRNWAALACGVGVIALLAACAPDAPKEPAIVTADATGSPTVAADPVDCTAEQLVGSFEMNPIVNIELRNVGDNACIIRGGFPTVEAIGGDGAPALPEAKQDDAWKIGTTDVIVEPGGSAWAVFAFGYEKRIPNATLVEVTSFSVTLPQSEVVVSIPYAAGIWVSPDSDNSLIVRPISAHREDTTIG